MLLSFASLFHSRRKLILLSLVSSWNWSDLIQMENYTVLQNVQRSKATLTIPFGPNVLFTKSPMAIAPTNDDWNEYRNLLHATTFRHMAIASLREGETLTRMKANNQSEISGNTAGKLIHQICKTMSHCRKKLSHQTRCLWFLLIGSCTQHLPRR